MRVNHDSLSEFVSSIDKLGGPDSTEAKKMFTDFRYEPATQVDKTLNPNSQEYWEQQLALYRELSGRKLDQTKNELTEFTLEDHIKTPNAYASADPSRMSLHFYRLSKLVRCAALPISARVLDLGCGWGLSSELFAMMGCRVTAVDINERFIELVMARSSRLDLGIDAVRSNFDDLQLSERFDLIVFNESLHHAVRPQKLLDKVSRWLTDNGKIAMVGEPIQDIWWPHWGLRLDALSVYCIRKCGWFENGWSRNYVSEMLRQCGLSSSFTEDVDPEVGLIVIARRMRGDAIMEDQERRSDDLQPSNKRARFARLIYLRSIMSSLLRR
jgi:2-polyprenyl-3-methyl-5-hydroxy-6-metoxy-1,4-benzoquinol methylase